MGQWMEIQRCLVEEIIARDQNLEKKSVEILGLLEPSIQVENNIQLDMVSICTQRRED